MAKETVKEVPWAKVVAKTEELSGIPKKQLDEVTTQLVLGIEELIKDNQPKRDGDTTVIDTPFGSYRFDRIAAHNVQDASGKTVVQPTSCAFDIGIPRNFINKANVGLIDKITEEEEKKPTSKRAAS
jgi:hypothetical protein